MIFDILCGEASWRPVNLLVFGASIISCIITVFSMLVLLADFSIIISLLMLATIIPQSLIFYRIQQEAFEVLVSNSADSRKLSYYAGVLLSKESIKDVQLYQLYDFFIDKYTTSFKNIKKGLKANRLKKLIASVFFLSLSVIVSVFTFKWLIGKTFDGSFLAGSILVFSSSIIYTTQSISRFVEDSSLLYDTLLYMQKYFNFIALPPSKPNLNYKNKVPNFNFKTISFKNVGFKYKGNDEPALKEISFTLNNGEKSP